MKLKIAMKSLSLLYNKELMGAVEIKTQLRQMIEDETDLGVLQAIYTILLKTSLDPALKEKLTLRALKSEEDIKAGRVFSKEEVVKRTSR